MSKKHTRHLAPWSDIEKAALKRYARAGLSSRQAAKKLGRTTGAVKFKAMVAGIAFNAIRQPKGVQRRLGRLRRKMGMRAVLRAA